MFHNLADRFYCDMMAEESNKFTVFFQRKVGAPDLNLENINAEEIGAYIYLLLRGCIAQGIPCIATVTDTLCSPSVFQ
jgi:hypothetical protein